MISSPPPHLRHKKSLISLLALALTPMALAHPGHGPADGLVAGFVHPLTGWDHLLAIMGIGMWASQLGGKARWQVPGAFLTLMIGGAFCGRLIGVVPGVEQAIGASVVVVGVLLAVSQRLPAGAAAALAGGFAAFHGLAHGAEMPATAGGALFGLGFVASTLALLAVGVAAGSLPTRLSSPLTRFAGAAIAAAGVILLAR